MLIIHTTYGKWGKPCTNTGECKEITSKQLNTLIYDADMVLLLAICW